MDLLTPFLMAPAEALVWGIFAIATLSALVCARGGNATPVEAYAPAAVCALALAAVLTIPFTRIWLATNFYLKRDAREQIVQDIAAGRLRPNVRHNPSLIALAHATTLSAGGNEVIVHKNGTDLFVLFFTFRGILGSAAGFLWAAPGTSPAQFGEIHGPITEAIPYAPNWYFVSIAP